MGGTVVGIAYQVEASLGHRVSLEIEPGRFLVAESGVGANWYEYKMLSPSDCALFQIALDLGL